MCVESLHGNAYLLKASYLKIDVLGKREHEMKVRVFRIRAAAFLLGVGMAATQLLTGLTGTISVRAETTQETGSGQALLVYLEDQNLGDAMSGDAKALKALLGNTNEFSESGIDIYEIPLNSDTDYKTELWNKIHVMAENTNENSFTVFTYSGHGNAVPDGTSYLAAGGANNITAAELRNHLDELQGRVLVIISCCFSGGMILPASDFDEVQESQETFSGGDFVKEFLSQETAADASSVSENGQNADADAAGDETQTSGKTSSKTTNPPKYYFITAANQWETSYSQSDIGTELISSFGHAMGYDRNNPDYHTFGADVSSSDDSRKWDGYAGDGSITMAELAAYYKTECSLTSTPTIYPEESNDVLFTYGSSAGHPATFLANLSQENVSVNADGTIEITPVLQNLTDQDIKLEAGVYDFDVRTFVYTTASSGRYPGGDEITDGYTAESGRTQEHIVKANECTNDLTFTFTANQFRDSTTDASKNPFCLKIWECTDAGEKLASYRALSFFTVPEDAQQDAIDASAFAFKKPVQLKSKDVEANYTVTKTSSRLPMDIIYDREVGDKYSSAPCLLSLYCYDVGDNLETAFPNGIQARKDEDGCFGVLTDDSGKPITLYKDSRETVFEGVRPTKERVVEGDYSRRGGIHTYVMDTSGLAVGRFYVLQAVCYDEVKKEDKSVYAIIQRTSAEDAEEYQIPFFELGNAIFETFRLNEGIPIGENWTENYSEDQLNVQGVGNRLQKTIQEAAGANYDIKVTNWKKQAADQSGSPWESMQETERFGPGQQYLCTIEVSVKDGVNAIFTNATQISLNWQHDFESVTLSEDKKTAFITIKHKIPSEEFLSAMKLEMFRTDGETVGEKVERSDTTLHPGDKVILMCGDGVSYCNHTGMKNTGKSVTYNGASYTVYEISDLEKGAEKADLLFDVWKSGDGVCGCGQVLYKWTIYPKSDDGKDDSSDGDTDGGDSSDKGSSGGDTTGGDTSGGGSSSGDTSGSSSSGSGASGNAAANNSAGAGASGSTAAGTSLQEAAGTNAAAAGTTVIAAGDPDGTAGGQTLPTGEENPTEGAVHKSGTSQGAMAVWVNGTVLQGTDESAVAEEPETADRKAETVDDGAGQVNATEADDSQAAMDDRGTAEEEQDDNIAVVDPMLRLYLILIWILAVLLGIAIYRYMKKRRS